MIAVQICPCYWLGIEKSTSVMTPVTMKIMQRIQKIQMIPLQVKTNDLQAQLVASLQCSKESPSAPLLPQWFNLK